MFKTRLGDNIEMKQIKKDSGLSRLLQAPP